MAMRRVIDWDRVAAMAARGCTARQIAARLGCSERSVTRILRRLAEEKKEEAR